jgi:phosphatidylinositol glycan class P protein
VILLVYIYVALASYNTGYLTLGLESIETVVDEAANVATVGGRGRMKPSHGYAAHAGQQKRKEKREGKVVVNPRDWKTIWSEGTDAVMDVPLGGVCEVLYGEGRDGTDDEG